MPKSKQLIRVTYYLPNDPTSSSWPPYSSTAQAYLEVLAYLQMTVSGYTDFPAFGFWRSKSGEPFLARVNVVAVDHADTANIDTTIEQTRTFIEALYSEHGFSQLVIYILSHPVSDHSNEEAPQHTGD